MHMSNEGSHRGVFLNEWSRALHCLRGLLSRPISLEQSQKQGLFFIIPIDSSVVDSTFEQSKNIAIAHFLVVNLSSCCWSAVRGVAYAIIGPGSKFVLLSSAHVHCTNGKS